MIILMMASGVIIIFLWEVLCPLLVLDHIHIHTNAMSPSLSDTHFLIILQYSLLPLKTPIKWVCPPHPLLFWLDSAEHQPPQSSAFMMLNCHQLDLIWSAPSLATRSDEAVCCWWWGVVRVAPTGRGAALSNFLIKAVIRPNPGLQNELLSEPGVPDSSGGRILPHSFTYWLLLNLHTYGLLCPSWHSCYNI